MAHLYRLLRKPTLARILLALRKVLFFVGYLLRTPVKLFTGFFFVIAFVGIFFSWFLFNDPAFAWKMAKLAGVMFVISFLYDFLLGLVATEKES